MARDNSLIWIFLVVAATVASWYVAREMKESEFLAHLAAAQHKIDTVWTVKYLPQPRRDSTLTARPVVMTHADSSRIDSAFSLAWCGGKDSTRAFVEQIAEKASTSVPFDSIGTVDVEYDPIDHMFIIGLQLAPMREVATKITDSVMVPVPAPDGWITRLGLIGVGTLEMVGVYALTK